MGNILSLCVYTPVVVVLAVTGDYFWILWMRKKMVKSNRAELRYAHRGKY